LITHTLHPAQIVIYTTATCGDCHMAKAWLRQKDVGYLEIDLEADPLAELFVKRLNSGFASVPFIVFPDGSFLVEPTIQDLSAKFSGS
jgi:mycoredoxin